MAYPYRMAGIALMAITFSCFRPMEASLGPVPTQENNELLYFPTTVGAKWVYNESNRVEPYVQFVSEVKKDGAGFVVTVRREQNPNLSSRFAVSEKGVDRIEWWGQKEDPPLRLLKFPAKVGDDWLASQQDRSKTIHTVVGMRRVTVPAGTYDALGITCCVSWEPKVCFDSVSTCWYAPGVGLVKQSWASGGDTVLASFTLPKATSP